MNQGNLFANQPGDLTEEQVESLAETAGFRVERIVSRGHASPPDFWYDQEAVEWVVLLSGKAVLRFEEGDRVVTMNPGDWIEIPARCRHRVENTSTDEGSVWLAVHGIGS